MKYKVIVTTTVIGFVAMLYLAGQFISWSAARKLESERLVSAEAYKKLAAKTRSDFYATKATRIAAALKAENPEDGLKQLEPFGEYNDPEISLRRDAHARVSAER